MKQTVMKYLDQALGKLKEMGIISAEAAVEDAPITALINQIQIIDEERVPVIARALSQASLFNEVVREQVKEMKYGSRYEDIANNFDSIRKDAKNMVDQVEDGELSTLERASNLWMKVTRGDISKRFDKIKDTYLEVARDTQDQIYREHTVLDAYQDFRGALKQAEILALEVLKTAENRVAKAQGGLETAAAALEGYKGEEAVERSKLELARDEKLRELQDEDARYQIAKDLSDNLTVGYNTSEVVMARLNQTTSAKQRVYAQSVSFFSTNETVLTALSASFTGLHGLHESTETLNRMKEGVEKSLETLAEIGGKVQEAALKAGYGPTVRAASVKKLVDAIIAYQERSTDIIKEARLASTKNAQEIHEVVEDGKKRMTKLAERAGSHTQVNKIAA